MLHDGLPSFESPYSLVIDKLFFRQWNSSPEPVCPWRFSPVRVLFSKIEVRIFDRLIPESKSPLFFYLSKQLPAIRKAEGLRPPAAQVEDRTGVGGLVYAVCPSFSRGEGIIVLGEIAEACTRCRATVDRIWPKALRRRPRIVSPLHSVHIYANQKRA